MNWCLWINVLNGYALKTKAIKSIVTKSTYSLFAISVHALSIPLYTNGLKIQGAHGTHPPKFLVGITALRGVLNN